MTFSSLNVAVLMGGPSAEAEVSRMSAGEVSNALTAADHRATLLELDATTASALQELNPDVVFPALHGPPGEDGTVQGFLELLGYPYVGSDVRGSAVAMDKSLAKAVFRREGLPVTDDLVIVQGADAQRAEARIRDQLGDRIVIKPLCQGSAIGVTLVTDGGKLGDAIESALSYDCGVLVEPYVQGREITVGVLDLYGAEPKALPVIEIRTASNEWYDYTNRYTVGKSEHIIPAPLPEDLNAELQAIALTAHAALNLRDLSRADYIVSDTGDIALLEVNTLPGMTTTSLFPDAALAMGMNFSTLADALVQSAHQRGNR
ncbi:MAG: D-alanine--D-alanine ligase [Pseudomonadales bacterium]